MLANDLASDVSSALDARKTVTPGDLLAGMVVLMDAAAVVVTGGKVVTFAGDGTPDVMQADASKRAAYVASDAGFGGQPVAAFAGDSPSNHCVYPWPDLSALAAVEAFVVMRCTYGAGGITFPNDTPTGLWQSGNALVTHYPHDSGGVYESFGTSGRKACGTPAIAMTQPHIYNLRSRAGLFEVAHNGAAPFYTDASNAVSLNASPAFGYQNASGVVVLNGRVALVAVCDRIQATDARAAFIAYLKARFAIA